MRLLAAATAGPLGRELAELARALARVTVRLRTGAGGEGCGVVWRDGIVVTNAHVARGRGVRARLPGGEALDLPVLARDTERDLAALAVPPRGLPTAPTGDPARLRPGELVVAFGHPLGVPDAVSLGVVHRLVWSDAEMLRWIAADLRLAPGNSGGPLAAVDGRVLGINTLVFGGLGYAVPVPEIERFLLRAGLGSGERAA